MRLVPSSTERGTRKELAAIHLNESWKDSASLFEEDGRVSRNRCGLERHPRSFGALASADRDEKSEPTVRESPITGARLGT
jgi:hypothetical protein